MSAAITDGVLAATYKLVQQAMTGQWQEVSKTVAERRVLLDRLSANAQPQDREWLHALQQAMSESDAAVAKIASSAADSNRAAAAAPVQPGSSANSDALSITMAMLGKGG